MPRGKWKSVPIPDDLVNRIDNVVAEDKYPTGRWHSRSHFIIEAVKEKLAREETEKETET